MHADQAQTTPAATDTLWLQANAIVSDGEDKGPIFFVYVHLNAAGLRMATHELQSLLNDEKNGNIGGSRQSLRNGPNVHH